MAIGSSQTLVFKGEAVHGGGSCQVSLTKDTPATKQSTWQVIHSIEGGCPARNANGNLGENAGTTDPDTYNYTIPQGIDAGSYTLAWTWFNKIGNREMYMNCASVKISSGSSKRDTELVDGQGMNGTHHNGTHHHDENCKHNGTSYGESDFGTDPLTKRQAPSFPAMFIANIPTSDCVTPDSQNVKFPDPGASVEQADANKADVLTPPTGPKCGSSSGSSNASASAPSSAPSSGASSGSSSSSGASSGSSGSSGSSDTQSASAGGSSAAPSGGSQAAAPMASAPAASAPAAAPSVATSPASGSAPLAGSNSSNSASASSSGTASSSGSSTGTCSSPGQSICSPDGRQIGTCTGANTVTWIPVADGTKCAGGFMVAASSKRSAKFAKSYFLREVLGA